MKRFEISAPHRGAFVLVAGADFTPASDAALDQAARVAARIRGCELHVIHAVARGTDDARVRQIASELETYLSEMSSAIGIRLERVAVHVRAGVAARGIAALAAACRT